MGLYVGNKSLSGRGGPSPYQIAVKSGYTGTEEEFNSLLAGIPSSEDQIAWDQKIDISEKGAANGVATLGSDGKVPSAQLPAISVDAYTKEETLKDTTAAQFGLGSEAVPDDVLGWIGKYNEYWWSLQHGQAYSYYQKVETKVTSRVDMLGINDSIHYYWSRTLSFDEDTGNISLGGTISEGTFSTMTYGTIITGLKALAELSVAGDFYMYTTANTTIYHIPQNATYTPSSSALGENYTFSCTSDVPVVCYGTGNPASAVTSKFIQVPAGETTYEHSTDRNAYPDSGTVDGITYSYLGVPFKKFPTMPQIETGSYTGTGTYGSGNPNSLTFGFEPKIIFIVSKTQAIGSKTVVCGTLFVALQVAVNYGTAASQSETHISVSGETVSWYSTDNVQKQFNMAATYDYLALG